MGSSNNIDIFLFSLSGLIVCGTSVVLVLILFIYGKLRLHKIFALFNFAVAWWGIGAFFIGRSTNANLTLSLFKIAHLGIIFIAVFFYHFSCILVGINRKRMIIFAYIQGFLFSFLTFYNFGIPFISSVQRIKDSFFYLKLDGFLYPIFLLIWAFLVSWALIETFLKFRIETNKIKKSQLLFILFWFCVGFTGGLSNFLPVFYSNIIPLGNFTIPIYCAVTTYAILKYRVLDIKIAVTRAGVFFIVYAFVLGIPVWLGFKLLGKGVWLLPVTFMGILATAGPFIYLYFQKRAEDRLLQEQRRYQATLRQASAGMGKIKDLKKLLHMIVYVLTHAIQIEHAIVYIYDEGQKKYVLGASKRKSGHIQFVETIEENSPLVKYFLEYKGPLIFEEIKQKAQDFNDSQLIKIEKIITSLNGELLVPIFIDQSLIAIIIMGKKESGKFYSEDDLAVFSILANQTALAIENAKFYEDMKFTHEQLFQAEKMATIGTMADGLSHQINNRFHALGFIAGDALDTIRMNQNKMTPEKMKEVMGELDRAFVRVQENVVQGGEIVQGLLKYTRKGEAGLTAIDADAVLKAALEMLQFKIKVENLKIIRDYDIAVIPKVKGNFTQLQEVFFNLIDNGYDAMMQRKNEQKEPDYQPTLIVRIFKKDDYAQIIFEDNGIGVKDEDMRKLFTPFFTTKLSSKKGTGLGLYVIKKIVEDNHNGDVEMVSKYMQGTQMKLRLPIAIG